MAMGPLVKEVNDRALGLVGSIFNISIKATAS